VQTVNQLLAASEFNNAAFMSFDTLLTITAQLMLEEATCA
jgi:hypothetical protein